MRNRWNAMYIVVASKHCVMEYTTFWCQRDERDTYKKGCVKSPDAKGRRGGILLSM